jgi:two-component system, NarL family, response regulator NreC
MQNIRILIAEDHTLVRKGFRHVLEAEDGFEVVAEAGDGRKAVELAAEYEPDVVIMDIGMPLLDGIEATRAITASNPEVKILVVSMHLDSGSIREALQAGALGFLSKDALTREFLRAIRMVASGREYRSLDLLERLRANPSTSDDERINTRIRLLTPREREIVSLVSHGLSNKLIASKLAISVKTVEVHKTHIYEKLELGNNAELVRFAIDHDLA